MGTTADKLAKLLRTKGEIADALRGGGADPGDRPFGEYPGLIDSLIPKGAPGTPEYLYETTRPPEWMDLPQPEGDELYMLMLLSPYGQNLLAFSFQCDGDYTVAWGAAEGGVFRALGETQIHPGEVYTGQFDFSQGTAQTADGKSQLMIFVKGVNITGFANAPHPDRNDENGKKWHIVDMCGRLPRLTALSLGSRTRGAAALGHLRFFSLEGENQVSSFQDAFAFCVSLTAVRGLYTGAAVSTAYMFYGCYGLRSLPEMDTGRVTDFSHMFHLCSALRQLPDMDVGLGRDFSAMFQQCGSLAAGPDLTGARPESVELMFFECNCLTQLVGLDISAVTTATGLFMENVSLRRVELTGENARYPDMLLLGGADLDAEAITALLEALPRQEVAQTIVLSNNPGSPLVDEEVLQRAEEKNWTVVL